MQNYLGPTERHQGNYSAGKTYMMSLVSISKGKTLHHTHKLHVFPPSVNTWHMSK